MLAESITRTGKTLAIFALDYRLAPESPWPAQLEDAAEGYSYLTREMGVPEEKVVLLGDSAGGHLVLALLTHLRYPHPRINPNPTQELEKPGAAVLLSPWASFRTDAESYRRNYYKDVVSGRRMAIMAAELRGPRKVISDPDEEGIWGFYTEFRHPVKGREIRLWRDVLPKRIYVSAGEDEVLVGDIVGFVESIREEMGARGVRFELYEGEIHDRWVKKVLISDSALGRHLKAGLGEEMEVGVECEELAGVILGLVKNDE